MSGHVVDSFGDPVVGRRIGIFQRQYVSGRRRFTNRTTVLSDDRGEFRASSLPPGEYAACFLSVQRTLPSSLFSSYATGRLVLDRRLTGQLGALGQDLPKPGDPSARQVADVMWFSDSLPAGTDPSLVYRTTCAPSTVDLSEATVVQLQPGDISPPMLVQISGVKGVSVEGVLEGADIDTANVAIRLLSSGMAPLVTDTGFEAAVAITDSRGGFHFAGVPPGTYRLEGSLLATNPGSGSSGSALRWLDQELTVSQDRIADLRLSLKPGFQVAGRIAIDGDQTAERIPAFSRFTVRLEPVDGRPRQLPVAVPNSAGTFRLTDVPPGQYFLRARNEPPGWALKSAVVDGRDVADLPLDLANGDVSNIVATFSNRPGGIIATVRDTAGNTVSNATVYAITTERRYWIDFGWAPRRLRWIRTDAGGQARLAGLPAGSYFVAALSQAVTDRARDIDELLEIISRQDQRLQIADAEQKTIALVVDGGRR